MGFNISGIVTNKNYKNDFLILQQGLNMNLEFDGEISFQEASLNWKEEGTCDIYFTDNTSICFLNSKKCIEDVYEFENNDTLTFILSEYAMNFVLNYIENGNFKRSIMEVDGDRFIDEGEALPEEGNESDISELIWSKIDQILGRHFGSIKSDDIAYRYKIVI